MLDMIGTIRFFPFDYTPAGYIPCDGRALSKDDYPELYGVIGNRFGGEKERFRVPVVFSFGDRLIVPGAPDLSQKNPYSHQYYFICHTGLYPVRS